MKSRIFWSILFLLFVLPGCGTKIEVGKPAPDFTVTDLQDKPVKLSDYRGKLVFLHFWADWCSECRAEFPRIEHAYEALKNDSEIAIISVNAGQSKYHVEDFKEEFGLTFPMLVDEYAKSAKLYQVEGIPTTFVIDPNGKIADIHVGWITEKYIFDAVERFLGKKIGRKENENR